MTETSVCNVLYMNFRFIVGAFKFSGLYVKCICNILLSLGTPRINNSLDRLFVCVCFRPF